MQTLWLGFTMLGVPLVPRTLDIQFPAVSDMYICPNIFRLKELTEVFEQKHYKCQGGGSKEISFCFELHLSKYKWQLLTFWKCMISWMDYRDEHRIMNGVCVCRWECENCKWLAIVVSYHDSFPTWFNQAAWFMKNLASKSLAPRGSLLFLDPRLFRTLEVNAVCLKVTFWHFQSP